MDTDNYWNDPLARAQPDLTRSGFSASAFSLGKYYPRQSKTSTYRDPPFQFVIWDTLTTSSPRSEDKPNLII